ncbi:hypothetical protein [Pseudoxanthomonas koreensis]|uniref:hypothetical protein n=1 Tax=Pseudoxanthomonas koreensis TaxID=266061 RepID=UPI0035A60AC9
MTRPVVALVSEDSDLNLYLVTQVLQHRRVPYLWIDPVVEDRNFDFRFAVSDHRGNCAGEMIDARGEVLPLGSIRSVWSRGASYFGGLTTRPGTSANLVHYESIYAYEYLWWMLRDRVWVNPILGNRVFCNRLVQTQIAVQCGMDVPRQMVATRGQDVLAFAHDGRRIIKGISQGGYRETGPRQIKTEYFRDDGPGLDGRLAAPVLLQEYIEKDHELRVVVVGESVYAAAIDSAKNEATALDSRLWNQVGLTYYRVKLADAEREALVDINRRLGLVYSSVDLVRGLDGKLYFLEVNPAGQWSFIEMLTGFPITERIVEALLEEA